MILITSVLYYIEYCCIKISLIPYTFCVITVVLIHIYIYSNETYFEEGRHHMLRVLPKHLLAEQLLSCLTLPVSRICVIGQHSN